jgi:minimal PKS acyl carrier protein
VQTITLDDLKRVLKESTGVEPDPEFGGEITDIEFEELGYDSLALLETAARISREYGIALDDDVVADARTPGELLKMINDS